MKNYSFRKHIAIFFLLPALLFCHKNIQGESHHLEQIYLHLQKNIYIAGEAIWFKAYCLDSKSRKLSNLSNVAYIELIDENGNALEKRSIILKNGTGQGGFALSRELPTGHYAINAYTYWMKSISKDLIHVSEIFVFNNRKASEVALQDSLPTQQRTVIFQDLKNKDQLFSTVRDFPAAGKSDKMETDDFIISSGIYDLNRKISIKIQAKDTINPAPGPYTIQMYSHKGLERTEDFLLTNGQWTSDLTIRELPSSTYAICIRDKQNNLRAQRTIHLNQLSSQKSIQKEELLTGIRKKVELNLNLSDFGLDSDTLHLSATIRFKEPDAGLLNFSFPAFHNLAMDFGNSSQVCLQSISSTKTNYWLSNNALIPLWCQMDTAYEVNANRYSETGAYILEGQLTNKKTGKPIPNSNVFLSKIGEFADVVPFYTKENGRFFFKLPLEEGLHDISIQPEKRNEQELRISLTNKFGSRGIPPQKWSTEFLNGQNLSFIKTLWENFKIRGMFRQNTFSPRQDSTIFRSERNFFGKPYVSISLKDYVQLDSLEEYFHEFLTEVKVRYRKNECHINIYNPERMETMHQKPLLLFDGLIMDNACEVLGKSVQEIERIEVVPFEYYYHTAKFHGIVHVISKSKKCELTSLPRNTERYYLPLLKKDIEPKEFSTDQWQKNLPDFRTDLLWQPDIKLTPNIPGTIEFYTSDVKGQYELEIQGISSNGEPVMYTRTIVVE